MPALPAVALMALLASACKAPPLVLFISQSKMSVSCDGAFQVTVALELFDPAPRPVVLRATDLKNIVADPIINPRNFTLEPSKEKLVEVRGRLQQPCDPGRFRLEADSGGEVDDLWVSVYEVPLLLTAPAEVTATGDRFRYDVTATCCPVSRPESYKLDLVGGIGVGDTRITPTSVNCPGPTPASAPIGPSFPATVTGRLASQEDEEEGEGRLGCRATDRRGFSCFVVTRIKR